jgi:hypothetical protein
VKQLLVVKSIAHVEASPLEVENAEELVPENLLKAASREAESDLHLGDDNLLKDLNENEPDGR